MARRTDLLPWYRQFWPWFLIAIPASTVVAGIFMIRLSLDGADHMVEDDYYKRGLAINEELAKTSLAQELGLQARIERLDQSLRITLLQGRGATPLELRLEHPFDREHDLVEQVRSAGAPGVYVAQIRAPGQRWYIELSGEYQGSVWRIQGEHDFDTNPSVTLTP